MNITDQAIQKLEEELKNVKGDQKVNAVKSHVAENLTYFSKQDAEFAQAIVQSEKTLGDCCAEIMKGCGNAISDLEVYRKAVQFYFPGSDIKMHMTINKCASVGGDDSQLVEDSKITIDLTDFL
ncbi:MAG: PcfK-like family protein [Oscillospiraceae bacterium]|nr:PcfK-like family protein [Oscillospiraceae bacterium]